jgi:hypothetical protein
MQMPIPIIIPWNVVDGEEASKTLKYTTYAHVRAEKSSFVGSTPTIHLLPEPSQRGVSIMVALTRPVAWLIKHAVARAGS